MLAKYNFHTHPIFAAQTSQYIPCHQWLDCVSLFLSVTLSSIHTNISSICYNFLLKANYAILLLYFSMFVFFILFVSVFKCKTLGTVFCICTLWYIFLLIVCKNDNRELLLMYFPSIFKLLGLHFKENIYANLSPLNWKLHRYYGVNFDHTAQTTEKRQFQ